MFKSILVTIDLGEKASWTKALPLAVGLARQSSSALHAIVIVPDFGEPLVAGYFPEDFRINALKKAKSDLEALLKNEVPSDVPITAHVAVGTIHNKILEAVEKTNADLLVMGSHAPDRIREFLVGSHADRVVRRSPVSVLVARA